jgi:SAM-dependent methyltransferase
MKTSLKSIAKQILPKSTHVTLRALLDGKGYCPPVGAVSFGNLRRVTPISKVFGADRGLPVDRYYIENFLAQFADDIQGHVVEVADNYYTEKFGGDRVTQSDVLNVEQASPKVTIVADLTAADHLPSNTFDCAIITQTLHLIYDTRAALQTLHRILKPGGVLLATFPGISQMSHADWGDPGCWCWNFTTVSARQLFAEAFPSEQVEIQAHGNVLTATCFLQGLATQELQKAELDYHDPDYEMLVTVRAQKTA